MSLGVLFLMGSPESRSSMLYPYVLPAHEASRLESRRGRLVLGTLQGGQGLTAMARKVTRRA